MSRRRRAPEEDPLQLLLGFLRGPGMRHDPLARFLLEHGQTFYAAPLPADVPAAQPRQCFCNAYALAAAEPNRLAYYEGFAANSSEPRWGLLHGWCVDQDGRVVDPTWWSLTPYEPTAYLGTALPLTLAAPYAQTDSRGTLYALQTAHPDDLAAALARLLASKTG